MDTGRPIVAPDDAGLDLDHFFLDHAFNRFQAQAQTKRLASFWCARKTASLTLAGADGIWSTPATGAFGGVAARGALPGSAVFELADTATAWLRREPGARRGVARLAPDSFPDPNRAALENALFRAGWSLTQVDLNYHLPATDAQAFAARLGETKQKQLRRLSRSGCVFRSAPLAAGSAIYDAIAANRRARGYAMTMGWRDLEALADAFPERVSFHAVERAGDILAGAVCLRVTATYLYVFYWGENPAFRKESPVMLLAQGLVAEARDRGAAILDLGISTDESAPNPGLITFKEMLGCVTTAKRTYTLDLDG